MIRADAPYDLVFANILARPLVRLAQPIAEALRPGGHAILSGLLHSQSRQVLAAYRSRGFRVKSAAYAATPGRPWCCVRAEEERGHPPRPCLRFPAKLARWSRHLSMRQTFDETTDPSFGEKHTPLIRAAMAKQGLDGFLIPHEDEHQNEYLPAANDRLAWATGFTGSAGAAVILKDKAAVFVDGRYTVQVREQVDRQDCSRSAISSRAASRPICARPPSRAGRSATTLVCTVPTPCTGSARRRIPPARRLRRWKPIPLDAAWGGDRRPAQPQAPVSPQSLDHAGEASASKSASRVGVEIAKAGAEAAVITAPASIAWLFNVRGGDVIRSPLPLAQAILEADGTARLFLDPAKVTPELPAWLGNRGDAGDLRPSSRRLSSRLKGKRVLIDPAQSSAWYCHGAANRRAPTWSAPPIPAPSPGACKNDGRDRGHAARAHVRDGAAL